MLWLKYCPDSKAAFKKEFLAKVWDIFHFSFMKTQKYKTVFFVLRSINTYIWLLRNFGSAFSYCGLIIRSYISMQFITMNFLMPRTDWSFVRVVQAYRYLFDRLI